MKSWRILTAAAAALLTAAMPGSWSVAAAAPQSQSVRVTADFLTGVWTDTGDCTDVIEFRPDGTFRIAKGAGGRWSLAGDQLSFIGTRTVTARVEAPDANTVVLTHADGSVGRSTRCGATPSTTAAQRPMPTLPASIPAAIAMSRATGADFLFGVWTDTGDCSANVTFQRDGRFVTSSGAQGAWRVEGERLTFQGQRTITARLRAVGNDRILLIHEDGTIGQSIRC